MVAHLTTVDRSVLTIGPVTVLPAGRGTALGQIARIIPTAVAAFNREVPHHFSRPEALVAARAAGTNAFDLITPATRTVNRFLLAIRLLYSVTSTGIYEVTGETSEIGRYAAHLRVLDYIEHPICLRPAVLSHDSAGPIQAILTLYDTVVPLETDKQVIQPLDMAFLKYGGTFSAKRWGENVVDLTTALEASLSGIDKTDISLRVCTRAAALLATDDDNPSVIFGDLKILYDLRSNLVHGSAISRNTLDGWLTKLSIFREGDMPNMRIQRAVDRLRDLVRRAIVARLLLAADGRWPLAVGRWSESLLRSIASSPIGRRADNGEARGRRGSPAWALPLPSDHRLRWPAPSSTSTQAKTTKSPVIIAIRCDAAEAFGSGRRARDPRDRGATLGRPTVSPEHSGSGLLRSKR
jgi:hypothetical protein